MRYAQIRSMDISNGEGVGVSLFVQGCDKRPHCKNCFNPETWEFNGGKEWTEETKNKFMELIDKPYIKRASILGGEPLAENNLEDVLSLTKEIRISFPEKTIWLYTGYTWEQIMNYKTEFSNPNFMKVPNSEILYDYHMFQRKEIIKLTDVLVDGEYIDEQRDLTLRFRGSKNQRIINVQQSLAQNKVILYCD